MKRGKGMETGCIGGKEQERGCSIEVLIWKEIRKNESKKK